MILPPPDASAQRTIRRSRIVSYVLVLLAAVVLSLRPDLFGDPQTQPVHALLHVWRIVLGLVLAVAALAVQVAVGVRWRQRLRQQLPTADEPPGNGTPSDR